MSVNIHFDTGHLAKEEAAGLLALLAAVQPILPTAADLAGRNYGQQGLLASTAGAGSAGVAGIPTSPPATNEHVETGAEQFPDPTPETPATRKRGEASPGKARRTKAEIAEDEAADAADGATDAETASVQGISTGEERVDPADVVEQDKADEQAEVENTRSETKPLTVDDVKAVVSEYVGKYGMPATQEDGPKIFVEALGAPPEGEAYWKMSLLPDDQTVLAKVVSVWQMAVAKNPLKRTAV